MISSRIMTTLVLIAIPVALFTQCCMKSDFIQTITNVVAISLICFAWQIFRQHPLLQIDKLLVRTYLIGFLVFSIWLGIHIIIRGTYDSSLFNSRDASIRSFCLMSEPYLIGFGAALAVLFLILCIIRIFIAMRNHNRRTRSLKSSDV